MRLFVDLDGVLAVWTPVDCEERLYEKGFYLNLKPDMKIIRSIREISEIGIDVYILSKYLDNSPYSISEKQEWCRKFIPEIPSSKHIWVKYSENKSEKVPGGISKDDFLLDDYTLNLLEFRNSGGSSIKYMNNQNGTKGTWDGPKVNVAASDSKELTDEIIDAIEYRMIGVQHFKIGTRDFIRYDVSYIDRTDCFKGFYMPSGNISDDDFRNLVLQNKINLSDKIDIATCSYVLREIFNDMLTCNKDVFTMNVDYIKEKAKKGSRKFSGISPNAFINAFKSDIRELSQDTDFVGYSKEEGYRFDTELLNYFDYSDLDDANKESYKYRSEYFINNDREMLDIANELAIPQEYQIQKDMSSGSRHSRNH